MPSPFLRPQFILVVVDFFGCRSGANEWPSSTGHEYLGLLSGCKLRQLLADCCISAYGQEVQRVERVDVIELMTQPQACSKLHGAQTGSEDSTHASVAAVGWKGWEAGAHSLAQSLVGWLAAGWSLACMPIHCMAQHGMLRLAVHALVPGRLRLSS